MHLRAAEETSANNGKGDLCLTSERPPGGETILVCDDEEVVLDSIAVLLEIQGYTVLRANGSREALEVSASHSDSIALLLTDVCMPEMNGWQLAQTLTKHRQDTKVIFMSGYTNDILSAKETNGKSVEFLQKPCVDAKLFRRVREVLDAVV
jgi:two-component system cell cycle sensor histidine kinase/response regulator CckA